MESIEKLRELAMDMNSTEIISHTRLTPPYLLDGDWLDSWHRAFDKACDEIEREIAERYMERPVDANGVPIRCGDVVDGGMGDSGKVQHIELWPDGFVIVYECRPGTFTRYAPDAVRHVKPRTIEDVLEDFIVTFDEWDTFCEVGREKARDELFAKYADELRAMGVGK